ncbi:MAG: DUF429 domain-containing protein [Phyllobacteriaceae bacterium]|nr:DUF429 domain-containing protein [Phyllobacteriaceae bacterium]
MKRVSIPSRGAVYADDYAQACQIAFETSDPPRKVSKQGFFLFGKIREIDMALRAAPDLCERVCETHPELVFALLNGAPLHSPKRSRAASMPRALPNAWRCWPATGSPLPDAMPRIKGAALDDMIDAAAALACAERRLAGLAVSFPSPPDVDGHGLPIAIWA